MVVDVASQPDSDVPDVASLVVPPTDENPWAARAAFTGAGPSRVSDELLGVLDRWLRPRRFGPRRAVAPAYRRGLLPPEVASPEE